MGVNRSIIAVAFGLLINGLVWADGQDGPPLLRESYDPAFQAAVENREGRHGAAPEPLPIYGDDYPTPDGTCVRDYIHVVDLARAHLLAMEWLARGGATTSINLGTKNGASDKEVVAAVEAVTGITIPAQVVGRRAGDPPLLIAEVQRARELLGWKPLHSDLHRIVATAWRWHERHPHGFASVPTNPSAKE